MDVTQVSGRARPLKLSADASTGERLIALVRAIALHERLVLACLLAAIGVVQVATTTSDHRWIEDHALYIQHARNIITGQPYGATRMVQNPLEPLIPSSYPPGFPLLLAPVYALAGLNLFALKLPIVAALLASLWLTYRLIRPNTSAPLALAVVAALGLNPYVMVLKNQIGSDVPFLTLCLLNLLVLEQATTARQSRSRTWALAAFQGFLVYLAVAMRTVGIVLLPTIGLYQLIKLKRIPWHVGLTVLVLLLLRALQQGLLPSQETEYATALPSNSHEVWWQIKNSVFYLISLRALWDNGVSALARNATFAWMTTIALVGLGWRLLRRRSSLDLFWPFYVAPFLFWGAATTRLMLPIVPIYIAYVVDGLTILWTLMRRHAAVRLGVVGVSALLFAVAYVPGLAQGNAFAVTDNVHSPDSTALFNYMRRELPRDALVVSRRPVVLGLYSGLRTYRYTADATEQQFFQAMDAIHADYILFFKYTDEDALYVLPKIQSRPERFQPIFSNDTVILYRLIPQS